MEQLTESATIPLEATIGQYLDHRPAYLAFRSLIDRVIALVALAALWPVMMLIAIVISIDSRGSVLFRQTRVGRGGRYFRMFKFRTMCQEAERMMQDICHLNEETTGLLIKIKDDPRVTRFGRLLRSTSLDELPQLINVLRGEMALIGPRPPSPDEVARYDDHQLRRLSSIPGLTGLWQVSGRKNLTFDQMVDLDIAYAERQSLMLDLLILIKTIPAVFSRCGAR